MKTVITTLFISVIDFENGREGSHRDLDCKGFEIACVVDKRNNDVVAIVISRIIADGVGLQLRN